VKQKKDVDRRGREREKKNMNDIEFQYVRSMSHLIKDNVIKHQNLFIHNHNEMNLLIESNKKNQETRANKD
jgi:hypothetical protein